MATGRISVLVGTFLRVLLMPVILIGVPAWPIVGLLCAVPIVGIFAIPLFILLTLLLLYSVAWFSYLVLAQADPPASSQHGSLAPYLPFLPYSPVRCLKINWAAFMYASSTVRVALPAVLDWSYRRIMVLGTQGGGGIVKENILYGSSQRNKRLDVYLPPSHAGAASPRSPLATKAGEQSTGKAVPEATAYRQRKHSTNFAEPGYDADATPRPDAVPSARPLIRAPVMVVVPSPIPPLTWSHRRKTYLQLALRLRRMGYCVIVPDITWYPEGRVQASVVDLRLVLRWTAENCRRYGGDERQIYLLGHGMSAHLAMLVLTQEAVVLSREGFLQRENGAAIKNGRHDYSDDEEHDDTVLHHTNGHTNGTGTYAQVAASSPSAARPADENAWVDEGNDYELPPGVVMNADETIESLHNKRARGLTGLNGNGIHFPTAQNAMAERNGNGANGNGHYSPGPSSNTSISNGLRRVEIYEPEIGVPPIAGVIMLSGVYDVIKCFRNESDRGVEHLSVLRRSCGPSHTSCLLHSPAHLLYAAKNIIDTSLLPPRFLLVHGGKDAVVDISQSTLLKTLLSGIGVDDVKLRAYRELGHVEALASLFLGMGKGSTRYSKQILNDISDFVSS
jgi:hypothetical protein